MKHSPAVNTTSLSQASSKKVKCDDVKIRGSENREDDIRVVPELLLKFEKFKFVSDYRVLLFYQAPMASKISLLELEILCVLCP